MPIKITNTKLKMKSINWEALSLTRFLLALIVAVTHLKNYTDIGFLKWYGDFGAFEAILGFLLISGFSIGTSISKNKTNYFMRRLQRIYPVYLAAIIFQIIIVGIDLKTGSILSLFINLVFLNQVFAQSFVVPAWTLATEVWLYCLAPGFLKMSKKYLYIIIFGSFLFYSLYTAGRTLYHWPYYSETLYGINLPLLAFIWVAGFFYAVHNNNKFIPRVIAFLFAGHILLSVLIQVGFRIKNHAADLILSDMVGYVLKAICVSFSYCMVIKCRSIPKPNIKLSHFFNLLGNISYPLYLTHATTYFMLERYGLTDKFLYIGIAMIISYCIYFIFDFYSKRKRV